MADAPLSSTLALTFGVAVVSSATITPLVRRVALALRVVDLPDARKIHTEPVPRMAGLSVASAAAIALIVALVLSPDLRVTWAGAGALRWGALGATVLAILVMGAIDDARGLSARVKFAIELAAAGVVVLATGMPRALDLSPFLGTVELGIFGPVFGILWIATLTNAMNMTDVVDGVAGGLGAIAAASLAFVSLALGNGIAPVVLLAASGALVGFLPHNFRRARIFLGDSGSLTMGFLLGSASLVGLESGGNWLVLPALLALAVPLAECALTMLRRTLRALGVVRSVTERERFLLEVGSPGLFIPDRRHIPHRLLELGLSMPVAVAVLYVFAGAMGALALGTVHWPWVGPVAGAAAVACLVYFAPRWLYDELRVFERGAFLPLLENPLVHSRIVHVTYDTVVVALSYLVSGLLMRGPEVIFAEGSALLIRTGVLTAVAVTGFWIAGVYRGSYRHAGVSEILRVTRAVLFGIVLAAGARVVVYGAPTSLTLWLLFFYLVLTGVLGARLSFRLLEHVHQRGRVDGRRALIFGAGRAGALALQEIHSNPELGIVPIGFVDDDPDTWQRTFHGYPVHAGDGHLAWLLETVKVQDLIVSTDRVKDTRLAELVNVCEEHGVRLVRFGLRWDDTPREGIPASEVQAATRVMKGA